jgi:hypothetical protein
MKKSDKQRGFKTLTQTIIRQLRDTDMFGHPIHLKYQGNPEYRSVFGGIVTIFTMFVLFLFTGLLLYRVATNEALSISNFTEL